MRKRRPDLTPDLTPLIDVIFLLLIFFMVTSVFKKEELALALNLPQSQSGKMQDVKQKDITIELTSKDIAYEGKVVSIDEIEKNLQSLPKDKMIIVRIDETVEYKRVVLILDMLQKNGLYNLSLVTKK